MISLPMKYNPIRIVMKGLRELDTVLDSDFVEPVGNKEYTLGYIFFGQINWYSASKYEYKKREAAKLGDADPIAGRIIVKNAYLRKHNLLIEKNDIIVSVGELGEDFLVGAKVVEVRPLAALNGRFLLTQIAFTYDTDKTSTKVKI